MPTVVRGTGLTYVQQILLAADTLPGFMPISEAKLAEALWLSDKKKWGLGELWQKYPDNNKVRSALVGAKGLVARGLFTKIAPLTYELTDYAKGVIAQTKENGERVFTPQPDRPLNYDQSNRLSRQLRSIAFARWCSLGGDSITLPQAYDFLEVSGDDPKGFARRLEMSRLTYERAAKHLKGGALKIMGGGQVTETQLTKLKDCYNFLVPRVTPVLTRRLNQLKEHRRNTRKVPA